MYIWFSKKIASSKSSVHRNEDVYWIDFFTSRGKIFPSLKEFFHRAMFDSQFDSPSGKGKKRLSLATFEKFTKNPYYPPVVSQDMDALLLFEKVSIFGNPKYICQAHFLEERLVGGDAFQKAAFPTPVDFKLFIQDYLTLEEYSTFTDILINSNLPSTCRQAFKSILPYPLNVTA